MSRDPLFARVEALIAEAQQLGDDLAGRAVQARERVRAGLHDLRRALDEMRTRRLWRSDE